jgi:uncharacterized protein (DUF2164 family)
MAKASRIDPLALSREQKEQLAGDIKHWFQEERGERLGDLAAELLVDLVQERAAKHWYNKGVLDAQICLRDRTDRMLDDIDLLRR